MRLESIPDIIAMKLNAIAQNGTRIKDFIDIATLSALYSFDEMLDFYLSKFPNSNIIVPLKSILYFEEIDFNEPIVMMIGEFNWDKVAKRLQEMNRYSKKIFPALF